MEELKAVPLTRRHPSIEKMEIEGRTPRVRISIMGFAFSTSSVELLGLKEGDTVQFFPRDTEWLFSKGDATGFKLWSTGSKNGKKHGALKIASKSLPKLFMSKTRFKILPKVFLITLNDTMQFDGKPLGEINIHKSVDELLKS